MEHSYSISSVKIISLQIAKVADFMESHPELVHVNHLSSQGKELWEELADSLNAEICNGGSFQPTENWKGWWKNYAAQLKNRYFSGLRHKSHAKILTTSDARLLKAMGYDKVPVWNAEQQLLNSTSVNQHNKGMTKKDLDIRIKSCFTLKKDEKSKTKITLFQLPGGIATAQRKSASFATLKTIAKTQGTQTCDPVPDTIATVQRKLIPCVTLKASNKSQSTQTCDLFTDAIATAQRKSVSCATLKTSEKSIATQTCGAFPDAITSAHRKSSVSCVTLKTSEKSKAKQACDPFSDTEHRKSVSCATLKTSKQSKAKQTCDSFSNVNAPAHRKSGSCVTLKTSEKSKAKQACDPFSDTEHRKSVSCATLKTSKQSKAKQTCDSFSNVNAPAHRKSGSCFNLKTNKNPQAKQTCDPNKQNAAALQDAAADINPTLLKTPTLPERSVNSPTETTPVEQIGAFIPHVTTAEAMLSIAKEFNLGSTLAKQKMELKQERLRLHKRKAAAVQVISKKMSLF